MLDDRGHPILPSFVRHTLYRCLCSADAERRLPPLFCSPDSSGQDWNHNRNRTLDRICLGPLPLGWTVVADKCNKTLLLLLSRHPSSPKSRIGEGSGRLSSSSPNSVLSCRPQAVRNLAEHEHVYHVTAPLRRIFPYRRLTPRNGRHPLETESQTKPSYGRSGFPSPLQLPSTNLSCVRFRWQTD